MYYRVKICQRFPTSGMRADLKRRRASAATWNKRRILIHKLLAIFRNVTARYIEARKREIARRIEWMNAASPACPCCPCVGRK